jgi:ATP-binding cassette subfamily F protein 3
MKLPMGKTVLAETMTAFEEAQRISKRLDEINDELAHRTDYESESYADLLNDLSECTERFQFYGGHTMEADAQRVLEGLGFRSTDMQRQTSEFSGGWQMRVELAKMLLQKPDYLLLDEPTNHLDIESILWLEEFLQSYEGTVVIISHDRTFLDQITKRTVEIELGKIYDYKANYSKFKVLQAERREKQRSTYLNQQKEIEHKEMLIEKFRAKASKAKMAQSLIKQLDKMDRVQLEDEDASKMNLRFPDAPRSGEVVVDTKKMSKAYGAVKVLNNVDFKLLRGERIAFVGQNGQGKTTLSKIIAGKEQVTSGFSELGYNVTIGYYAQNQADTLDPDATVLETLERISSEEMRPRLRTILGSFMFSGEDVDKKIKVLSGGERARVALACLTLHPVNLLILDEPTNHLDMISKDVLKSALLNYDGALIVVSHDRSFLADLTRRTLEFRDHKLHNHLGDVKTFLEKRKLKNMREVEMRSNQKNDRREEVTDELSYEERKHIKRERSKIERKIKDAERKIEKLEKECREIEMRMSESTFYDSPDADTFIEQYKKLKTELDKAMSEWETYEEQVDEYPLNS